MAETETPIRLLLVEDDQVDRQALQRHFASSGQAYELTCAVNGAEAREKLGTGDHDVVLLDYQLGDATGLELLPLAGDIPAIFITGMGNEEVAVKAIQMGAYDYIVKDGKRHYLTVLPLIIRNVLSRKAFERSLQESQRQLRTLMGNLPGMAYRSQPGTSKLEFASDGAFALTGYTAAELTSDSFKAERLVPEDFAAMRRESQVAVAAQQPFQITYRIRHRNGEERWVLDQGAGVFGEDGALLGLEGLVVDISDRVHAERGLQRARDEAQAATRLKDKFVSLVAHDLRAPISTVKTMAELIGSEPGSPLNATQQALQNATVERCDAILHMIDELLKVSRLQTGNIRLHQRYFGPEPIRQVARHLHPLARRKGIALETRLPKDFRIFADLTLYSEVVQNLISNALKFCGAGDRVELIVPEGKPTTLAVRDTGPGVQPEFIPNLFRHDVKTSLRGSDGETGFGFGLPLCQDILVAHRGRIWLESTPGQGTTFFVELPTERPRVLLVEGEQIEQDELTALLRHLGYEALTVENAESGLAMAQREHPHLVIAAAPVTAESAEAYLHSLRNEGPASQVPLVLVLDQEQRTLRDELFRLGAEDFLMRPVDETQLSLLLRTHLG